MFIMRLIITFTILTQVTCQFVFKPGPLIPASKGEIWPTVQHEDKLDDGYFSMLPLFFQFKSIGTNCRILSEALDRYKKIILYNNRLIKQIYYVPKTCYETSNSFYGYLTSFEVDLAGPCDDDEYPSLEMKEEYVLNVTKSVQRLTSATVWGILRGLESLSQLVYLTDDFSCHRIETTSVYDYPRLQHRGLLLDTSRHFHTYENILSLLDGMSYNKLNVFHWHITDDYSFPYVSIKFPELSNKGAFHPQLMVYSQAFIADVIEYARLRGIRVIPEFGTPGHTLSWGLGNPDLLSPCYNVPSLEWGPVNPTKNSTYTFIYSLFDEISEVFNDNFIHLGGDEVEYYCWQSDPAVNEFMLANGIETYHDLQSYYAEKIIRYVVDNLNLQPIVWEEIFTSGATNLPASTVIQVWRNDSTDDPLGLLKNVTSNGYRAILSAYWYLNLIHTGGDWLKFYNFDPLEDFNGTEAEKKLVIGAEASMWSELVNENNLESRAWPRACVAAEKFWSPPSPDLNADINAISAFIGPKLEEQACRMKRRGIKAQPANGPSVCF